MFTPQQYRSKADEYTELAKTANNDRDLHRLRNLERSFVQMADNEQWLADNHDKMVHAGAPGTQARWLWPPKKNMCCDAWAPR